MKSDKSNREIISINEANLKKLAVEMRNHNIFPLFLPFLESYSEKHPINVVKKLVKDEIKQQLSVIVGAELEELILTLNIVSQEKLRVKRNDNFSDNLELLTNEVLYDVLIRQKDFSFRDYLLHKDFESSIVLKTFPELMNAFTKRNDQDENQKDANDNSEGDLLLRLDTPGLRPTEDFFISYKNKAIQYHPCLRNGFTSHPNFSFLKELINYSKKHKKQQVSIAIDHLRLAEEKWYIKGLAVKDIWLGTPMNWENLDTKKVAFSVYDRRSDSEYNILGTRFLERTEFFWSYRDNIRPKSKIGEKLKTLQIEEVCEEVFDTINEDGLVITRYIHTMRDIESGTFFHLDGAVKLYELESYKLRYDSRNFERDFEKQGYYIKLFRIDSRIYDKNTDKLLLDEAISNEEWSELICTFFKGNEMVLDYFSNINTELRNANEQWDV